MHGGVEGNLLCRRMVGEARREGGGGGGVRARNQGRDCSGAREGGRGGGVSLEGEEGPDRNGSQVRILLYCNEACH